MREWSLFACRNICESLEENRQEISKLKAQSIVSTSELEQMGLKATIENTTGKVTINKFD